MIYYIDESCIDVLKTGDTDCVACLEALALSRRLCENILIAERQSLDALAKSERLSDVSRAVYRKLYNKSSEFRLILKSVVRYCMIIGEGNTHIENSEYGQTIIRIPVREMSKRNLHKLSIMLAENTDDIKFYKIIGRYYIAKSKFSRMNIVFEDRLGGGSTTADILESIITNGKNMCLCLADSDKKYNGHSIGETLGNIVKIADKYKDKRFFWDVIPLEVHEIENLIPVNILEIIQKQKGFDEEGIKFIKFLIDKSTPSELPYLFFDFKNGIPMKKFFLQQPTDEREEKKFKKLEPYRQYWRKYIEEYGIKIEQIQAKMLVNGVCEKILKHTIEYFSELSNEELLNECKMEKSVEEYWDNIGSKVLAWGCVGERLTV